MGFHPALSLHEVLCSAEDILLKKYCMMLSKLNPGAHCVNITQNNDDGT